MNAADKPVGVELDPDAEITGETTLAHLLFLSYAPDDGDPVEALLLSVADDLRALSYVVREDAVPQGEIDSAAIERLCERLYRRIDVAAELRRREKSSRASHPAGDAK